MIRGGVDGLMRVAMLAAVVVIMASGLGAAAAGRSVQSGGAGEPVSSFALGVYWPWERTDGIARNAGLGRWEFARRTCALLARSGVNTIWLVNIGASDVKALARIAGPMHIKLVPTLNEIEPRGLGLDANRPDFASRAIEHYRTTIPRVVDAMGAERADILAWGLCDEPGGPYLELMEPMRRIFAEADPDRPVITVSTWGSTPDMIAKTRLFTFCTDLYPFFSAGNPNGPNTPGASRNFLTTNTERMVQEAGKDGRIGWLMPQCYNEIWGPYEWDSSGALVALPGSFVHWRTPTPAEIRWQIWEGVRLGVKGIVFFCLLGPADSDSAAKPVSDPALRSLIVRVPTTVGAPALLDRFGRPTPQMVEAASIFRELRPHLALLRRLTPVSAGGLAVDGAVSTGYFRDPKTGGRYVVIVNPDFEREAAAALTAARGTTVVTSVLAGRRLRLEKTSPALRIRLKLPPGGGALLRVEA